MGAFGYRKPQDLPAVIPVFPLAGALLLPRGALPLNIFEPRYLNMIDDAISGDRLIGMIQPSPLRAGARELAPIGCAGRLTGFTETDDGRYLITLTGVSRFALGEEISGPAPYRRFAVDFEPFALDLEPPAVSAPIDRDSLSEALRRYAQARGFQVDWEAVEQAPPEPLVNAVATLCPFDPAEKQALLEAGDLARRCATLITLLELNAAGDDSPPSLQ